MLELRPNCEICDVALPAKSAEARTCSCEFTYCASFAGDLLKEVCPNFDSNVGLRLTRPTEAHRNGRNLGLTSHHARKKRRQMS